MKNLNSLLVAFLILFASCTDERLLDRKERRITGTWKIEKANFRESGDIFRDNVTIFYEDDLITFYDDYTAVYEDSSLGESFDGDWAMILERDEDDDKTFLVDMIFYDHVNNEEFSYFSEITFLTHKKFNMTVDDGNGIYRFKLRKF